MPFINNKLESLSYQFPNHVLGYFDIVDLNTYYYNDYIYVGLTPLFVPPAL